MFSLMVMSFGLRARKRRVAVSSRTSIPWRPTSVRLMGWDNHVGCIHKPVGTDGAMHRERKSP